MEPGKTKVTIWRMRIACYIPKAANTHSEYVTLTAFPLQQWLHEGAFMLRYTYTACYISSFFMLYLPTLMDDWTRMGTFIIVNLYPPSPPRNKCSVSHYNPP